MFDELMSIVHHGFKIIAGKCNSMRGVTEPLDVLLYLFDKLMTFLLRIRVIKPQITIAAVDPCCLKIDSD